MCIKGFVSMHVTFGLTKASDKDETSSWLYCAPGVRRKIMKYLAEEIEIVLVFKNTKQEN